MMTIDTGNLGINDTQKFRDALFGNKSDIQLELGRFNCLNLKGVYIELDDLNDQNLTHRRVYLGVKPEVEKGENCFRQTATPFGTLVDFELVAAEHGVKILKAKFEPFSYTRDPESHIGKLLKCFLENDVFYIGYAAYVLPLSKDRHRIEGIHSFFPEDL